MKKSSGFQAILTETPVHDWVSRPIFNPPNHWKTTMSYLPPFHFGCGLWHYAKPTQSFIVVEECLRYDDHGWYSAEPGRQYKTLTEATAAKDRLAASLPGATLGIKRRIGVGDYILI